MQKFAVRRTLASMTTSAVLFAILGISGAVAQQTDVRFRMEWIPNGMYAPFFYAIDSGFYREQGINLEMLNGNGSLAAIEEVAAGKSEFAMASCGALATAISKGRPIVSIAQYTAKYSWGFYVPKDSGIVKFSDLAGRSVVMSPGSSEAILLPTVFDAAGLAQNAMRWVSVDPSQKIATYARGQGDSVVTTVAYGDPLVQEARPSNVLLWADAGFTMPDYCLLTNTSTIKDSPELVRKFLAGTFKGIEEGKKKPNEAVAAALKMRPLIKQEPTARQWELTTQFLHSDNAKDCAIGWHVPKDWEIGLATLRKANALDGKEIEPTRFYTNEFVKC